MDFKLSRDFQCSSHHRDVHRNAACLFAHSHGAWGTSAPLVTRWECVAERISIAINLCPILSAARVWVCVSHRPYHLFVVCVFACDAMPSLCPANRLSFIRMETNKSSVASSVIQPTTYIHPARERTVGRCARVRVELDLTEVPIHPSQWPFSFIFIALYLHFQVMKLLYLFIT